MKYFLSISLLFLLFSPCYGQKKTPDYSYIVTSKKVVMRHHNETAVLTIPVASAKYPALRKALCDTCLFFGDSLEDVINDYRLEGSGITSLSYELTFVNKNIISLKLYYETMGAYPSESQRWLTLNTHTGQHYALKDEIIPKGLNWVLTKYKTILRKRISGNREDKDCSDTYNDLKTAIDNLNSNALFKGYLFTKDGIMVSMEPTLPHVVQSCESARDVMIPYIKLKPFKTSEAIVIK
jgi:hypothetical protein